MFSLNISYEISIYLSISSKLIYSTFCVSISNCVSFPSDLRVMDHSKQNRMEAQNVAIVFGPTLMRPQEEKGNMAANLVMQGQIIEYMLHEYKSMF